MNRTIVPISGQGAGMDEEADCRMDEAKILITLQSRLKFNFEIQNEFFEKFLSITLSVSFMKLFGFNMCLRTM